MLLGLSTVLGKRSWILGLFVASLFAQFLFAYTGIRPGGKILGLIFGSPRVWARMLPVYLAGVVAYLYRERLTLNRTGMIVCLAGLAVAARIPYGLGFAMPTLGTYLLLWLAFTSDWKWHNAAAFGDFSYGVYLYAFPIQQLIMHWIGHPTSPWTLFALASPLTLLAGILSWHLVEKRFLKKTHARIKDVIPAEPPIPADSRVAAAN